MEKYNLFLHMIEYTLGIIVLWEDADGLWYDLPTANTPVPSSDSILAFLAVKYICSVDGVRSLFYSRRFVVVRCSLYLPMKLAPYFGVSLPPTTVRCPKYLCHTGKYFCFCFRPFTGARLFLFLSSANQTPTPVSLFLTKLMPPRLIYF